MKKIAALIAVFAVAGVASADLTQFKWDNGTLTDNSGAQIAYGSATIFTLLDQDETPDVLSFVSDGKIDIADLKSLSPYAVLPTSGLPFKTGLLKTDYMNGDGTPAGKYAVALVFDGVGATLADISVGDYIGISATGFQISDLQPDLSKPANTGQTFNAGAVSTNIQVIPEPATVGLLGVAGLGLFLARRKARS